MDAATIAAKVRKGYGKAAHVLGRSCAVYRPAGAGAPIADGNLIVTQLAAFDTVPQFSFVNPTDFKNRDFYALTDATLLDAGDYLVCQGVTYFVATMDDVAAPMCVRCDTVLTLARAGSVVPGPGAYGGGRRGAETTLLTSWPAGIQEGSRGERGDTLLASDTRMPWVVLFFPSSVPIQIRNGDFATTGDAAPMTYVVSNAEQTALGWRCTAGMVQT